MAGKQGLKQGEKVLFAIFAAFVVFAVIGYIAMETIRMRSDKPLYAVTTHYDFSTLGKKGSKIFREARCTSCHRAVRNGTNMGLSLDGVGSKRTQEWLLNFMRDPEATFGSATLDHGPLPKEASYVAEMPVDQLQAIAAFLSELRADRGSPAAEQPPEGRSDFIDNMLKWLAPENWKDKYQDVREIPTK
ncbi:MAG: cytochrome c [Gammaproteobacteria bacterium]|nr:cytochrome c [Gammaproteobacteria bacterium]